MHPICKRCFFASEHRLRRRLLYTRVPATYNERKIQYTTRLAIVQPNSPAPDLRAKHLTTFSCTQGGTSDQMAGKQGGDTNTASPGSPMPALNLALWLQSNTLWCQGSRPNRLQDDHDGLGLLSGFSGIREQLFAGTRKGR